MKLPDQVKIVDVAPRDGLQNEAVPVSVEVRVGLIERLADAGVPVIESGSFVSPKWVPKMADSDKVLQSITQRVGVSYPVLTPNMKGFEAAIAAGAEEVAVFAAASESFSQKNINCSIAESLERFAPLAEAAESHDVRLRGYVSCVLGCPYEGEVTPKAVADVARELYAMGCYEVSLGDTIGTGTPLKAARLVEAVAAEVPVEQLAAHFHDTYGQALANLLAVMQLGVNTIDASVAGLGGCPYARGATGNVATEDVVYMLHGMDIATGIDLEKLVDAGLYISQALGREPVSRAGRAIATRRQT